MVEARPMLLDAQRSLLLVIDVQARLAPAVSGAEALIGRVNLLLGAAARLGVPVIATEQYPKGLGHLDERLAVLPEGAEVIAKTAFACGGEPGFLERLAARDRPQLVLCGMEAHICVLQTALALREGGWPVFVVADAVGSRDPARRELALARMRHGGCEIVDSEMVLFEWLRVAGTDAFREFSKLVR